MRKQRNVGDDAYIDSKYKTTGGVLSCGNTRKTDTTVSYLHQNKTGITLVALVVTIIVLLILTGITINLAMGQKGILQRAEEAGKNYQEATKKEAEDLEKSLGEVNNIIVGINTPTTPSEDKYTMVDGVPVPKGFEHVEGTKETGFVIRDNSGTETNGNEFVWVPCTEDGAGRKY